MQFRKGVDEGLGVGFSTKKQIQKEGESGYFTYKTDQNKFQNDTKTFK